MPISIGRLLVLLVLLLLCHLLVLGVLAKVVIIDATVLGVTEGCGVRGRDRNRLNMDGGGDGKR